MKFSYELIKKLSPRLPSINRVTEASNLYSFEVEEAEGDLLDIALPANRYSDAASHLGIAREVSASLGKPLKNPVRTAVNVPAGKGFVEVDVENKASCPRYSARLFEIRKIPATPVWMKNVLKTCGLKPINGVVDLMNFVMLEIGQPLHAFDADKLASAGKGTKKITVRKAKNGERIETLDGQRFTLDANDTVIADAKKALAIAGIKGGENSGVDARTKRIIVEAANFDPVRVFKTSRKLKLITDAGIRFSHGISPALVPMGMDRITELLVKGGAKLVDSAEALSKQPGDELIEFNTERYAKLVGGTVAAAKAKKIFSALGFSTEKSDARKSDGNSFMVRIPAWRTDIENQEDIIEEIARMNGYNKLKPQVPAIALRPAKEDDMVTLKEKTRNFLAGVGVSEVYNHSFSDESGEETVMLENPISSEFTGLRTSLMKGLLKNIADNGRFFEEVRVFEIGKVFKKQGGRIQERLHLGIAVGGKDKKLALELKGIAEDFFASIGIADCRMTESGKGTLDLASGKKIIGTIRTDRVGKKMPAGKQDWNAYVCETDLDAVLPIIEEGRAYRPLPKYPAVVRDMSVLVTSDAKIGDVTDAIKGAAARFVDDIDLIDEYSGGKLGGKQSLTFRIIFQAENKTLTDAEVERDLSKIVSVLRKSFGAEIR